MRLRNLDITAGKGLNVDANVVVKGPLIFNVKLGSDLRYCLVDYCLASGGKYAIVHVYNKDEFVLIEHTVLHTGISEYYFF